MESLFGSPDTGPSPAEIAKEQRQDALANLEAERARARARSQRTGVSTLLNTGLTIPGVSGGNSGNGGA